MILLVFLLWILIGEAQAAKRFPVPPLGAPVQQVVTGGYAFDFKDCTFTTPYGSATDTESSSGTMVRKLTGSHEDGQILCPVNVAPGTYYLWAAVRPRGVINDPRKCAFWTSLTPFRSGFQNTTATLSCTVAQPTAPSFHIVPIGADANFATVVQGTSQATFSLGSGSKLYFVGNAELELDWIFLSTNSSATPIPPSGAPATGITHNATGATAAGDTVSSLSPTINIAAGSDRILFVGIAHRTNTNTISSVSSSVNGALSLVNWTNNDVIGCAVYRLLNPTVGFHTVTITLSQAQNAAAGLVAYNGVNQQAPTGSISTSVGTGNPSSTVASAADQLAISHLCISVDNAETITTHASQTQRWQKEVDVAGGPNRVSAWSDEQGAASVAMDWTITGTKVWAHQAFALRPPSGAINPPVIGTPSVTLLGSTSATVQASVDDSNAQCDAEYDTNSGSPYANNTPDAGPTGGFAIFQLTGLSPGTPYFYRIRCSNAGGNTNGSEGTFNTTIATAVTALGITQAEINIWNARRTSGPYRVTGDVSANSPGDFSRILASADSMVSSPETTWSGQVPNSCWIYSQFVVPGRTRGDKAVASGFMFLLTGDAKYKAPVLNLLLAQAAVAGTDFSNTTRWTVNNDSCFRYEPGWEVVQWLTKLTLAYSFIRHDIPAGNKTTLDTWFTNAGTWQANQHQAQVARYFPNRLADDYTTYTGPACTSGGPFYHGGPNYYGGFHSMFENTVMTGAMFLGHVGVLLNNSTFKTRAAISFKEWVKFAVYSDNTSVEFHRSSSSLTSLGYGYAAAQIGAMIYIADYFARTGDPSLYDYTTSLGHGTCTPAGGPKNLRGVIINHVSHLNGTITRYIPGFNGNPSYRIDSVDELHNNHFLINDINFAMANVYYNDSFIKAAYMRTLAGAPAYPVNPSSGGDCVYCGAWGITPGVLGMHGQMEGLVDPYP